MLYNCFHSPLMQDLNFSASREYLVAGTSATWSASTISGCHTRKYHGLLVAPQAFPGEDNYVILSSLDETYISGDKSIQLYLHRYTGSDTPSAQQGILAFEANPLPRWWYQVDEDLLLKEIVPDAHGGIMVRYTLLTGKKPIKLQLRPLVAFRNMHSLTRANTAANTATRAIKQGISINLYPGYNDLFLQLKNGSFQPDSHWYYNIEYNWEKERGYDYQEDLYSPGYFEVQMAPGESVIFYGGLSPANTGNLEETFTKCTAGVRKPETLKDHLLLAAEQFLMPDRIKAGFYWFGSWGRDTCISLPGLTLLTGKINLFKSIVRHQLQQIKNGLLPNAGTGTYAHYNTVDASLWLIWALQQYVEKTHSWKEIWHEYGKPLKSILTAYRDGTLFNIHMEEDGLIYAGGPGLALTWMDAIAPEGPVTPRTGKAVEVNALWYNAVCFCLNAATEANDHAFIQSWETYPEKIAKSFIACFWSDEKKYLADCVNGDIRDWSVRPNQLFAVSLPSSPLLPIQQRAVMEKVKEDLVTPRGLRTLSPSDPQYLPVYGGDQPTRDRAYHQGTVWPWLLGHFTEALLKAEGPVALPFLEKIYDGFKYVLDEYCLNNIPELFDGDFPHCARGAVAQAWSVAELIRMEHIISGFKAQQLTTTINTVNQQI
ncbi:amylo-alpha-1,6-glucosidase [Chitinophaga sp. CF418]|uniref:amylo-alpha-1,6-glucosidase n=1 Tax=Chitinophaga sp. CF418 TaxID=1855287 RepID=UPI0009197739|nr:amylo-alpha-1,6-glucosidase [Chitinophaga sp. CF418]SHN28509.1 glycogen debranching enzyme, putative [Chitinophaga sp. CF418]